MNGGEKDKKEVEEIEVVPLETGPVPINEKKVS